MDYSTITTVPYSLQVLSNESCNNISNYCEDGMKQSEVVKYTAVALIRMVTSILSILGTASIIVSVIVKRQVKSSKVHPIFALSIADFLLALLWVIGGILWMTEVSNHRVWCFMVTLTTCILECVAINLTFVYALYAYAHLTHMNLNSLISNHFNPSHGWSKPKVALVYIISWLLPTVIVMIPFGGVAGFTDVLHKANTCTCGCVPKFLNVLPYPANNYKSSAITDYLNNIARLDVCLSVIIAAHYIIVFPLLVLYYYRVLKHIRKIRKDYEGKNTSSLYGATEAVIVRGHSQAKHRVFLFLTVFVVTGLCNLILACLLTVFISIYLMLDVSHRHSNHTLTSILTVTLIIQSITVPLQGFLNAIVYGWTREDFLFIMAATHRHKPLTEPPQINNIDTVYDDDEELSDLESSYYDSEAELSHCRHSRQQTPETNMSGNW